MNITQEQYDADIRAAKAQALLDEADKIEAATKQETPDRRYRVGLQWAAKALRARAEEFKSL